ERVVTRRARELAQDGDGNGRPRRDRARDVERGLEERVLRHDLLDEPPLVGGSSVDPVAGEVEKLRAAQPDESREALRSAAARDEPELDLRLAELGVLGGDPDVT